MGETLLKYLIREMKQKSKVIYFFFNHQTKMSNSNKHSFSNNSSKFCRTFVELSRT